MKFTVNFVVFLGLKKKYFLNKNTLEIFCLKHLEIQNNNLGAI